MAFKREVRTRPIQGLEIRSAEGSSTGGVVLGGYAAVFDSWTTLFKTDDWELREVIRPGAFTKALAAKQDVRALYNHDPNYLLGRTRSGTLRLAEDAKGLRFDLDVPAVAFATDLVELMRRGDVDQCSFAFSERPDGSRVTIVRDGDLELWEVEILDVDLYDVSIVVYPAYEATSVEEMKRSRRDARKSAVSVWLNDRRATLAELSAFNLESVS